ncbi:MAG: hypothetical protein CGW95_00785 [Phenylobacterium zucineum]|nr:MAG: hypothetical protein CGW95_00785 [Phenylobacterium zucineum]
MSAADVRCGLFDPSVGSALNVAKYQARGAALRAGTSAATLQAISQKARIKAYAISCTSPDLALAAGRVRTAFDSYAKMLKMDYPGDIVGWKADRSSSHVAARWRLTQDVTQNGDRLLFGLAGRSGANALLALVHFKGEQVPYTARLVMRDDQLTAGPFLDDRGAPLRSIPLDRRFAANGAQISYTAEARSSAGSDLMPKDMTSGWAFRFPAQAARQISGLDPREAMAIDFIFPDDSIRRLYVEVGDFAAGRAFLQSAGRPGD